jgi:RimJ/RimL family protein N-acetyltransferase
VALDRAMSSNARCLRSPGGAPGLFVVGLDGAMIGIVTLDRRGTERQGQVRPEAGEAELGYMFLREVWGCGYAAEACAAALNWFADALPGKPVVLCTQTANERAMRVAAKLGFAEVERFEIRRSAVVWCVVLGHAVRLSSWRTERHSGVIPEPWPRRGAGRCAGAAYESESWHRITSRTASGLRSARMQQLLAKRDLGLGEERLQTPCLVLDLATRSG